MNKHDPIIGRYVYINCQGKSYRTYYEENGDGIPMVCLHTAGTDGRQYRHQLCDSDMASNFRVIAFDLPRHGKSIPPEGWHLEVGENRPSPYTKKSIDNVLATTKDNLNVWVTVKANVKEDFKKFHDLDVNELDGLAIMADTDNSKMKSISYFQNIYFSAD